MKNPDFTLLIILILAGGASRCRCRVADRTSTSNHTVELPAPTGKHTVGRTTLHWIDATRAEAMTDDPNAPARH